MGRAEDGFRSKVGFLAAVSVAVIIGTSSVAVADCHNTSHPDGSEFWSVNGDGNETAQWSHSNSPPTVYVGVSTNTIPHCYGTWFDWATASGHYDWRLARNCRSNTNLDLYVTENHSLGTPVLRGLQRTAVCGSATWDTNHQILCHNSSQNDAGCDVPEDLPRALPNPSTYVLVRYGNNDIDSFTGGWYDDPDR
jgi:hypothetical protein